MMPPTQQNITFGKMRLGNVAVFAGFTLLSVILLVAPTPLPLLPTFFGVFVAAPFSVILVAKKRFSKNYPDNTSKIFYIFPFSMPLIALVFGLIRILGINITWWLIGFLIGYSSVYLWSAWSMMAYSVVVKREVSDHQIHLKIIHKRLVIGTSVQEISINKGTTITLLKSRLTRYLWSFRFNFHYLQFSDGNKIREIPFIPFEEKGLDLAVKMQRLFADDVNVIMESNLLNSANFFVWLTFPKVKKSTYIEHVRESNNFLNKTEFDFLTNPSFTRQRIRGIRSLVAALVLGLICVVILYPVTLVTLLLASVTFLQALSDPRFWVIALIMGLFFFIFVYFFLLFTFQGIIEPLRFLFGQPVVERSADGLMFYTRLGRLRSAKIMIPAILNPRIERMLSHYSLTYSLDWLHTLTLPLGSLALREFDRYNRMI